MPSLYSLFSIEGFFIYIIRCTYARVYSVLASYPGHFFAGEEKNGLGKRLIEYVQTYSRVRFHRARAASIVYIIL